MASQRERGVPPNALFTASTLIPERAQPPRLPEEMVHPLVQSIDWELRPRGAQPPVPPGPSPNRAVHDSSGDSCAGYHDVPTGATSPNRDALESNSALLCASSFCRRADSCLRSVLTET